MRNRGGIWKLLVVLVMVMVVVWLGACASDSKPPIEDLTTEEAMVDGEAMLQESCTQCHNLERITSKQKTREEWTQTVDRMIQKGAQVADKEAMLDYLAENYGS